jgi:20S proteasome subunit alpha 3
LLNKWVGLCPFRLQLTASNILAGLAGITSDANSLVNFARNAAQRHLFTYDEDIPVEMLVQRLCDMKQGYTQYGGMLCHLPAHWPRVPD